MKKVIIVFGSIFVLFLIVSNATAIKQTQSQFVNNVKDDKLMFKILTAFAITKSLELPDWLENLFQQNRLKEFSPIGSLNT